MMTNLKRIIVLSLFISILSGCLKDEFDKYSRPEWLVGKIYTQVLTVPELSTFAQCLELTGYDTIVNISGSYTLFAPSNEAFQQYFQGNPNYNSIESMPIGKLTELVKYHIVQNPWSKNQLRSLDVYGWIDTLDINNNEPKGFKRETLLLNKDIKVGIKSENKKVTIVDTLKSSFNRRITTDSRKYSPIFFNEYFDIYDLNSSDYEFYFDRPFDQGELYYAGAKIIGEEIFAENGFIYKIDKVVEPLKNGYEILSAENSEYSDFLDLLNKFPELRFNEQKTNEQPGATEGLLVDSLFDISYPELLINIANERTRPPSGTFGLPSNVTIRYHYGLMAPTNDVLSQFLAEYIEGPKYWGTVKNAPLHLKRIIVNSYLSANPIYETDLEEGFYNGELDIVKLDKSSIIDKQFGSNTTFIGLDQPIVPRAFNSVTGPVYRQQRYSVAMYAIEASGLLSALKRENKEYSFYVENDLDLREDSSLVYNPITERFSAFQISEGGTFLELQLGKTDLRALILNQIGIEKPNGIARKEFIKTMGGNFLIINNETGVVSGTVPTTDGFGGIREQEVVPVQISDNADNGITYDVSDWFGFAATDMFSKVSVRFPKFHALLVETGLALPKEYRYSFISESEVYTVFAPSDEALENFDKTLYTMDELRNILLMHFVQGEMIFTDGNKPSGYYETNRIDESSTPFSTIYSKIYIETGYDEIILPSKGGEDYLVIPESNVTNMISAKRTGEGDEVIPSLVSNRVIHEIDKVLLFEELDTN